MRVLGPLPRLQCDIQPVRIAVARLKFRKAPVVAQPAVVDEHQPAADLLDVVHVVRGEQEGRALAPVDLLDKVADAALGHDVQADRRLVQEDDLGIVQQGDGDVCAHLLPEGELAHGLVQEAAHLQNLDEQVDVALVRLHRDLVHAPVQAEGVGHGQIPVELRALAEHDADMLGVLLALLVGDAAVHQDLPRRGRQDSGEHLDGGGLSRAVGAHVAHEFAVADGEADVVHRPLDLVFPRKERAQLVLGILRVLVDLKRLGDVRNFDHRKDLLTIRCSCSAWTPRQRPRRR